MQNGFGAVVVGASRLLIRFGRIVLVGVALATPAAASPIAYTMEGTFGFGGEGDPLSLVGARLVIVAVADSEDAPAFTSNATGLATATFLPLDLVATISNRPGGAPDVALDYAGQLQAQNFFPPGSTRDNFRLFAAPAIFEGTAVTMPEFAVFFPNQAYFPGTGTPSLPLFAPGDVQTLAAGFLGFSQGAYLLSDRSFTAVPEPGAALLVALSVGLMGAARGSSKR